MNRIEKVVQCGQSVGFNPNDTITHSLTSERTLQDRIKDGTPPSARQICPLNNSLVIQLTPPDTYEKLARFRTEKALDRIALEKYLSSCVWMCLQYNTDECPLKDKN